MANAYLTSDTLIESVKRRHFIPDNQNTFDDEDFLDLANEEMQIGLVPSVLQLHEDYFLVQEYIPLVENQTTYDIPYRAIGNKLRDLAYEDSNNNIAEMTRIPVDNISDYQKTTRETYPYTYYIKNNQIVLLKSNVSGNGNLVFSYYLRPNQLVDEDRIGVITNINTTTGEVTLSSLPSHFTTSLQYDFIQTKSSHKILDFDLSATNVNTTAKTVTFDTDDLPSDLIVGDCLAQAGETKIPNIPTELHVVLAHRVAARCLEALGDMQGLQSANAKLVEMEQKTGNLIDNRVEGSPKKIVNRHGFLAQSRYLIKKRR